MKIHITKDVILHKFIYRLIFKICLDIAYIICIVPFWLNSGYFSYSLSSQRVVISYLVFVILCELTPIIENKISSVFFNTQLYIAVTPMTTIYMFADTQLETLIFIAVVLGEEVILYEFLSRIESKKIKITNKKLMKIIRYAMYSIVLITLAITLWKVGFANGISALDFTNVYVIRDTTKENMGIIVSYFLPWTTKVILPFLIVYFLHYQKWGKVCLVVILQVYFYLAYANKVVLFTIFLIFAVYYAVKKNKLMWLYEKGLIYLVIVIASYDLVVKKWSIYSSLLIRRVFFLPASLKYIYFEFFQEREKVLYADGLIGRIFNITSPYSKSIPNLIGEYVGSGGYMNTGYLGETFANAGVLGLLLIGFCITFYLCLLEKYSKNININISLACSFYILYSFNEGAFFTLMLTYGGILLLFIFYSVNNEGIE